MTHSAKGFTLVEVVVSVVIVAATAAGIFASFIAAQNYVSRSKGRVGTSNAIRQQIENLKVEVDAEAWYQVPPPPPNCDPDLNGLALTANATAPHPLSGCACSSLLSGPYENGWTCWKNVTGTFGQAPLYGKRRYKVTELTPGGARQAQVQVNWTEPGT